VGRVGVGDRHSVTLPHSQPFAAEPLLTFLRDRAIPGVEEVRDRTYRRSIGTSHGSALIALTPFPGEGHVRLDVAIEDGDEIPHAVRIARRLFDLDADPAPIARALGRDPFLRPLIRKYRGLRLPGTADGFELVVRAILGQQVSVAAARTVLGRVAAHLGTPLANGEGAVGTLFPQAEWFTDAPLERLGITSRRASAIRRVAAMVASGELDLSGEDDPDEVTRTLLDVDGIGPWMAEYVRMRALRDPDAFLSTDLGVRRSFERLGLDATPHAVLERAEAWRPWRAYATMLLWQQDGTGQTT